MPRDWLQLCDAWGFEPVSELVWRKLTVNRNLAFGMGRSARMCHEICVIAKRGRPQCRSASIRSMFDGIVREHSRKPEESYDAIRRLFPAPRVELFAREHRPGFLCYGEELGTPLPFSAAAGIALSSSRSCQRGGSMSV